MGLRHHSPTPQGAAVVAVPSSDRHHDGGGGVTVMVDLWWKRGGVPRKFGDSSEGRVVVRSDVVRWWPEEGEDGTDRHRLEVPSLDYRARTPHPTSLPDSVLVSFERAS
ncbi:hypothetical protein Tco_0188907 [Tanacetum coccineum]